MKLTPHLLLNAYCQGIFPMAQDDGTVYWSDPDPRAVLPLESFHASRSLRKRAARQDFDIRINAAFREVMVQCAAPGKGRDSTWISEELIDLYTEIHHMGYAHSVETWMQGNLVGGLYGVAIGGFFAGESMFSRVSDSSKLGGRLRSSSSARLPFSAIRTSNPALTKIRRTESRIGASSSTTRMLAANSVVRLCSAIRVTSSAYPAVRL